MSKIMTGSLQEKNYKFYVVVNLYINGKRKLKWIPTGLDVRGNKRKALEMLNDILREYEEAENADNTFGTKDMLFADFMVSWLDSAKNSIKENTHYEYKKVLLRDIYPYFMEKGITLQKLTNLHIQTYYNELIKRMTANSVLKRHALIYKALNYTVMSGLVEKNVSDYVILPKKEKFVCKFYNE